MPLETGDYISDLIPSNPAGNDLVSDGDNHIRLIKKVLTNTFPGADKASDLFTADPLKFREQKNLLQGLFDVPDVANNGDLEAGRDMPHYRINIDTGLRFVAKHDDQANHLEGFTVEVVGSNVNFDARRPTIQGDAACMYMGMALPGNGLHLMGNGEVFRYWWNGQFWQVDCIVQPITLPVWRLHDDGDTTKAHPSKADWGLYTFGRFDQGGYAGLHKVNNQRDIQTGVPGYYSVTLQCSMTGDTPIGAGQGQGGWMVNNASEGAAPYRPYAAKGQYALRNGWWFTESLNFTGPITVNDRISTSTFAQGGSQYFRFSKQQIELSVELIRR